MKTEKSQPSGLVTDNAENSVNLGFPALSVYSRVAISLSASGTDVKFYLTHMVNLESSQLCVAKGLWPLCMQKVITGISNSKISILICDFSPSGHIARK